MYSDLIRNTTIYGIGTIFPKIINYIFLKIFTTILKKYEFSFYSDIYAISFIVVGFLSFGLESAFFRFLYRKKYSKDSVLSTGLLCSIIIASIFLITGQFFITPISNASGYEKHQEYFKMIFTVIFIDTICIIPFAWLRVNEYSIRYATIRIISVITQLCIIVNMLIYDSSIIKTIPFINKIIYLTDKTGYIIFSNLISSSINLIILSPIFTKLRFRFIKLNVAKSMLSYGKFIMLGTFSFAINENFDKILIKRLLSDDINSSYTACYKVATLMNLYVTIFRLGIEPFFFKKSKDKNANNIYSDMTYLFIIAGMIFYVIIYSNLNSIIDLIVNKKYHNAIHIIPIILLANMFLGIYTNLSIIYKVNDIPVIGAYISLVGGCITILLNSTLLITSKFIYSAISTLISYSLMLIISYKWIQSNFSIKYSINKMAMHIGFGVIYGYVMHNIGSPVNLLGQILYVISIIFLEKDKFIKVFIKN